MSEKTKQLRCNVCGAFVSTTVPINTVVRGWIECPECIERAPDVDKLRAENERMAAHLAEYTEMSKDGRSEMIDMENDKLKSTLRQIGQAVTPGAFNSQLENWILAQVDGVLNDEN